MPARRHSASKEKWVWDVNVLAIYLVEDHPANEYVSSVVEDGLRGAYTPVLLDILPLRALWIMERMWGCGKEASAKAVAHFLAAYDEPVYAGLTREALKKSFELAEELRHDVYDCAYLALALQVGATTLVTTDTDFEGLCPRVGLRYLNPVPMEVLREFSLGGGRAERDALRRPPSSRARPST